MERGAFTTSFYCFKSFVGLRVLALAVKARAEQQLGEAIEADMVLLNPVPAANSWDDEAQVPGDSARYQMAEASGFHSSPGRSSSRSSSKSI